MESRGPRSRTSPASRASAASAADGDSRHVLFRSTDSVHLIDSSRPPATHLSADDDAGGLTSVEDASCPWTVEPWAAGTLGGGDDAGERPSVVVGVDFGTTNSCVAVWAADKRRAKVIKVSEGAPLLPTAVSFGSSPPAVGAAVRRDDPAAVFHCKRLIGRSMGDPCVAAEAAYSPQAIVGQPDGAGGARPVYRLRSGGPLVTPDDAARAVLGALANAARAYVRRHGAPGLPPGAPLPAVLTVPAHFGAAQRDAIRAAADAAGFRVLRLLNEPCAAAMAYGLFVAGSKRVLVVDLGGGTLDVSLLAIAEGRMRIVGTGGDEQLGGEDFTRALMALVLERSGKAGDAADAGGGAGDGGVGGGGAGGGARSVASPQRSGALQAAVERAKIALSSADSAEVLVPGGAAPVVVTRRDFDAACAPLVARVVGAVRSVLEGADVAAGNVQELVVVGGGCQAPVVRAALRELMGGLDICQTIAPGTAVAMGAAIQGAIISGVSAELLKDVLMMDVLSITWGLEGAGGDMVPILPKNSVLPAVGRRRFELHDATQPGITVEVYEGEAPLARDNRWYTYFNFPTDGAREVDVVFRMSEGGVLTVSVDTHVPTRAASRRWACVLFLYALLAAALYVLTKFMFVEERREWEAVTAAHAAAREAAAGGSVGQDAEF